MAPEAGFYGKIPARGDFVRAGLPGSFVTAWDGWLQRVFGAARARLGEAWDAAWLEAPVWRFSLPPGQCGPAWVLGVWLPSVDSAGRHFPLTLAAVLPDAATIGPEAEAWLDAAEQAGRQAIADDLSPAALFDRLPAAPLTPSAHPADAGVGLWWTAGSPYLPAGRRTLPALPDVAQFAAMVLAPTDQPEAP